MLNGWQARHRDRRIALQQALQRKTTLDRDEPGTDAVFRVPLQCSGAAEHVYTAAEAGDTHRLPQSATRDLSSKPSGFSCSKERCLVISSSFPLASKMCCQAAEIAQEFEPAALKKATSNENFLQAECN